MAHGITTGIDPVSIADWNFIRYPYDAAHKLML